MAIGQMECSRESTAHRWFLFRGTSMWPFLQPGDLLGIRTGDPLRLRVGDVVIFSSTAIDTPVVHRVSGKTSKGLRTRGDNCNTPDPWITDYQKVIGKVISLRRGSKTIAPSSRIRAKAFVPVYRFTKRMAGTLLRGLYPFCYRLSSKLNLDVTQCAALRLLCFPVASNQSPQLLWGTKRIGWYQRSNGAWHIVHPWRWLIDPQRLPRPGREDWKARRSRR